MAAWSKASALLSKSFGCRSTLLHQNPVVVTILRIWSEVVFKVFSDPMIEGLSLQLCMQAWRN